MVFSFVPFVISLFLSSSESEQTVLPSISNFVTEFTSAPVTPRGIYLTNSTIISPQGDKLIQKLIESGGNAVTFDIQTSGGKLGYRSSLPIVQELGLQANDFDLAAYVSKLHEKNLYAIARFVLYKQSYLARKKPEWTLKTKGGTRPFVSREGPIWLDPSHPELHTYLQDVVRELAQFGVDEVQFDYVRFPEGGKGGYIGYTTYDSSKTREQILTDAVRELASELHWYGVKVGVDLFGIIVWDNNLTARILGQNVSELGKYVDAIYPMPYPSHFGPGWGGHKNPADEPYFFVQETSKKFREAVAVGGGTAVIRPWLQGFTMRVSRFGPWYIETQIKALQDIGIDEFMVWNASNNYSATFPVLGKTHGFPH